MLSTIILGVANKTFMLSVVMLSVVILNVVAPEHLTDCRGREGDSPGLHRSIGVPSFSRNGMSCKKLGGGFSKRPTSFGQLSFGDTSRRTDAASPTRSDGGGRFLLLILLSPLGDTLTPPDDSSADETSPTTIRNVARKAVQKMIQL
jgi:hypothetical protein